MLIHCSLCINQRSLELPHLLMDGAAINPVANREKGREGERRTETEREREGEREKERQTNLIR